MIMRHERMLAKLIGYLDPLSRVMIKYPEKDKSVPAHYARAIASALVWLTYDPEHMPSVDPPENASAFLDVNGAPRPDAGPK